MKHQITRTLSLCLAILTVLSAISACGKKASDTDWRADVTDVLSAQTTTKKRAPVIKPATTAPVTDENAAPSDSFVVPEGYIAGEPHPLTNPDAGEIPSISYGRQYILYQDYLYYPASFDESAFSKGSNTAVLCYSKLSDLVTGDLTANNIGIQPAPLPTFVCNDPFCNHKSYDINNEVLCPLYFAVHHNGGNWRLTFYCLDYGESNGSMPVFYICAAEPEYRIVGAQVIETESKDVAIYRYDSATGKRTLLAEDLPGIYFFAQSGDYLYYSSYEGLTVLDKTGKEKGRYRDGETLFQILDVTDDTLYITDQYGDLYTSDRLLTKVEKIHTHEFDTTTVHEGYIGNVQGDANGILPFGYVISDGYLYYCDDFKLESEVKIKEQYRRKYSSSIYRLSLKKPDAEPEFLTDGVSEYALIGVFNGKVYYEPYGEKVNGYYKRYLNCVDANTKEITVVIDNGYDMPSTLSDLPVINEKFIIARSLTMLGNSILIYDLETGDYCYLYQDVKE